MGFIGLSARFIREIKKKTMAVAGK